MLRNVTWHLRVCLTVNYNGGRRFQVGKREMSANFNDSMFTVVQLKDFLCLKLLEANPSESSGRKSYTLENIAFKRCYEFDEVQLPTEEIALDILKR